MNIKLPIHPDLESNRPYTGDTPSVQQSRKKKVWGRKCRILTLSVCDWNGREGPQPHTSPAAIPDVTAHTCNSLVTEDSITLTCLSKYSQRKRRGGAVCGTQL